MPEAKDLARVDGDTLREGSRTAASGGVRAFHRPRTEQEIRGVVSTLCHYLWNRQLRPGDHLWSIPVDTERDFDCILSDAATELIELRKALQEWRAWAQFVYLGGGGPVTDDDDTLRLRVNETHDRDVLAARAAERSGEN